MVINLKLMIIMYLNCITILKNLEYKQFLSHYLVTIGHADAGDHGKQNGGSVVQIS
jgi:hypothetical protein